jgi:DNA-binding transcriptional MerR regulator
MNKLGLTAADLFNFGIVTNLGVSSEKISKILDKKSFDMKNVDADFTIAREEALINTVALMIEKNNEVLMQQLKQLNIQLDL